MGKRKGKDAGGTSTLDLPSSFPLPPSIPMSHPSRRLVPRRRFIGEDLDVLATEAVLLHDKRLQVVDRNAGGEGSMGERKRVLVPCFRQQTARSPPMPNTSYLHVLHVVDAAVELGFGLEVVDSWNDAILRERGHVRRDPPPASTPAQTRASNSWRPHPFLPPNIHPPGYAPTKTAFFLPEQSLEKGTGAGASSWVHSGVMAGYGIDGKQEDMSRHAGFNKQASLQKRLRVGPEETKLTSERAPGILTLPPVTFPSTSPMTLLA